MKIEFIREELRESFPELLEQAYYMFRNNDKFHREQKAEQKKKRALKHGVEKKIKKEHLNYIKDYLDDEKNLDTCCLKSLV